MNEKRTEHMCYNDAMLIRNAYKYRIYPNKAQQKALRVQFGHSRFVYWLLIALGLAVVASILPARSATHLTIREAISYE